MEPTLPGPETPRETGSGIVPKDLRFDLLVAAKVRDYLNTIGGRLHLLIALHTFVAIAAIMAVAMFCRLGFCCK